MFCQKILFSWVVNSPFVFVVCCRT